MYRSTARLFLFSALGLALVGAESCPGPQPFDCANPAKVPGKLLKVENAIPGQYLVTLRADAPASRLSVESVSARVDGLAARYGIAAANVRTFALTSQFAVRSDRQTARQLLRDDSVLFVEEVGTKSIGPIEPSEREANAWGLDRIDQRDLPLDDVYDPGDTGAGIHAYIIDTGIDLNHPEFAGRMGEGISVFNDTIDDDHGHGTHVAGTVGGITWGVAKQVILHRVRVLRDGSGADSDVIEGIDWVTQHVLDNGWPAVANMSLGGDTSVSLDTAVCRSIEAGVVHVVAAGNDGNNACFGSPARVKQAVGTGATDKKDKLAWFSNTGICVDVYGPGVNVKSAGRGGGTDVLSGTSMASPHAAGVAALALARHPGSDPAAIYDLIQEHASLDKVKGVDGEEDRLLYAKED